MGSRSSKKFLQKTMTLDPREFRNQIRKLLPDFSFKSTDYDREPTTLIFALSSSMSLGFYRLNAARRQKNLLWKLFTIFKALDSKQTEAEYLFNLCFCQHFEGIESARQWYSSVFKGWKRPLPEEYFTWSRTSEENIYIFPFVLSDAMDQPLFECREEDRLPTREFDSIKAARFPKNLGTQVTILVGKGWLNVKDVGFRTCSQAPSHLGHLLTCYCLLTENGLSSDENSRQLSQYLFHRTPSSIEWFKNHFPEYSSEVDVFEWKPLEADREQVLRTSLFTRAFQIE